MKKNSFFSGNLIFIGFGSITKAAIPLFLKQKNITLKTITVISPEISNAEWFANQKIKFIDIALTEKNLSDILDPIVQEGDFIVNLSVNVSSFALIHFAHRKNALYIDTCIEPWEGGYTDPSLSMSERTNYALRQQVVELKKTLTKGPTAIITHGANPGLISHFLKAALVETANQLKNTLPISQDNVDWGKLAMQLGVKVIHIAERDTQRSQQSKRENEFINTWSVDGFISEMIQPAELGWGTHEKTWPNIAKNHNHGSKNAIYLERPGASINVKTWTPLGGACLRLLITHNESISISDYLTVKDDGKVLYRPTVHYAYRPCDNALLSINEFVGGGFCTQKNKRIMNDGIVSGGMDALGILIMGHDLNAYWYGSILSIDEARNIAPFNTATSLQVAAGVFSGVIWAIENPKEGILEPEQIDYERILEIAKPYLGEITGIHTDWNPIRENSNLFNENSDRVCTWQFNDFSAL